VRRKEMVKNNGNGATGAAPSAVVVNMAVSQEEIEVLLGRIELHIHLLKAGGMFEYLYCAEKLRKKLEQARVDVERIVRVITPASPLVGVRLEPRLTAGQRG
jgi:hypothetical protein